jgi:hypothetical protein
VTRPKSAPGPGLSRVPPLEAGTIAHAPPACSRSTCAVNARAACRRRVHPIDKHMGARVRMRRIMLNMSQEEIGDAIGSTYQQVQKYTKVGRRERGTKRAFLPRLMASRWQWHWTYSQRESAPGDRRVGRTDCRRAGGRARTHGALAGATVSATHRTQPPPSRPAGRGRTRRHRQAPKF